MSFNLLERFFESDHFNADPSLSVAYLARYADHIGIQYVLCGKLRRFPYEEIEFFLPQLCHLLISLDNESMALEDFIIDLCEESVNGALLTFWLFQTYLHDLAPNPLLPAFTKCRRIYNKVQRIVFGATDPPRRERLKENIPPIMVLSSLILAGIAAPWLPGNAGPLAIAQARRPRPAEDVISDAGEAQKVGMQRSSTTGAARRKTSTRAEGRSRGEASDPERRKSRRQTSALAHAEGTRPSSSSANLSRPKSRHQGRPGLLDVQRAEARLSSTSLPEIAMTKPTAMRTPPLTSSPSPAPAPPPLRRRHSSDTRLAIPSSLSRAQQTRMLRANYFRSESAFLTALEDISNRLVIVPKPARLSALRAELAVIAQDLPAEVDIPMICPATLENGTPAKSRHHRIVRLNPAEATSLNSAERVPYLLMVEVLREDFDFNPETETNQQLLVKLMAEKGSQKRRLFDLTDASREVIQSLSPADVGPDSVFEPLTGDLSSLNLVRRVSEDDTRHPRRAKSIPAHVGNSNSGSSMPRSSSGANTVFSSRTTVSTPRSSDLEGSRSNSPGRRRRTDTFIKAGTAEQPDISALATHMRTAAQMLAQLETSGSKRPKPEVAAIKAKIIASMQSLEEQTFIAGGDTQSFDSILGSASAMDATPEPDEFEDAMGSAPDPGGSSGAGAARMENDAKTGGVTRQGDRDDPSAAMVGEDWAAKKERIRRSSPYGWMPNWDLVSVIVKTGADLRQEAFACQLIQICSKIWEDANIPVWVKNMRILVTGESSGLIETISNGVSLHSIKRSLTLASIAAGTNPRKRIATLKDHFLRAFGEEAGEGYDRGADAFVRSLAAYSMVCYVLQLKDRHNGNLLIDNQGHMVHIDFGFMLSNSPGSMGFEAAPFKLTQEYVDVMGGVESERFAQFKALCKLAFAALRKESERIVTLVELMGRESKMPCFAVGVTTVIAQLRARFAPGLAREELDAFVDELVAKSVGSYYTRLYDTFQYRTQGIY